MATFCTGFIGGVCGAVVILLIVGLCGRIAEVSHRRFEHEVERRAKRRFEELQIERELTGPQPVDLIQPVQPPQPNEPPPANDNQSQEK